MRAMVPYLWVAQVTLCLACASPPPPESPKADTDAVSATPAPSDVPADDSSSAEPSSEAGSTGSADTDAAGDETEEPSAIKRDPGEETRTTKVIQEIVRQNRQLVRDCYEKALRTKKGLEGELTIHFVIGAKGDVKTAELNRERSTLTDPAVVECSVAALKGIRFPPSSRGFESQVNYPFNLNP